MESYASTGGGASKKRDPRGGEKSEALWKEIAAVKEHYGGASCGARAGF